jgi:hypothetical protein
MKELDREEIIAVLKVLNDDWAIVDDNEEDDFVVFVNESRETMEDFQPKKLFIKQLEQLGYIKDSEQVFGSVTRELHAYNQKYATETEWTTVTYPCPIVYLFNITEKGKSLLLSES